MTTQSLADLSETAKNIGEPPSPLTPIAIRPATLEDVSFMDALQKLHSKQVGWMPTATLEGKIRLGHVLIAEAGSGQRAAGSEDEACCHLPAAGCQLGYLIGNDQYFKRDDVGVIYQLNVAPARQRAFIGAALLKAQFERSAYGCRLYCCWCAQDIEANRFWEAMGFVPLAFRTGSRTKGERGTPRVHIFWQKRIRARDETTPFWFPAKTGSGSIREDRIVLPIPPGTHWSDAKPLVLPGMNELAQSAPRLPGRRARKPVARAVDAKTIAAGGMWFASTEPPPTALAIPKKKREKAKHDPKLVAAARELRDRWLEQVNNATLRRRGKYDVSRVIAAQERPSRMHVMRPAAAIPIEASVLPLLAA